MVINAKTIATLGLVLACSLYSANADVDVEIDKGILRGTNSTAWMGAEYFTFKGIPYGKPPMGELRFKGPEEEPAWSGVREALVHKSVCPHVDMASGILRGTEDCLYLNVYTPVLGDERLPVMFWIHGGGFVWGSGNSWIYGPDYFMEAGNVVLVTVNYRLGAFGFLSTEDDGAPGNAGLKDQVAALRWVRRNIAKFGGDPDNVTIFGESAGAASAHYHILSPMSKGLFAKAILQSASALDLWTQAENAAESTIKLAVALGAEYVDGNTTTALEFLKAAPYRDIVKMVDTMRSEEGDGLHFNNLFTPSVEKDVTSEEVFLSAPPLEILESGNYTKVPCIIGYNSHEGYLLYENIVKEETIKVAIEETERFVPRDIENKELREDLAKSIREIYFDDKPVAFENISNLVDLYTDINFVTGINRATKLQLNSSDAPIYFYVFPYSGELNLFKFFFSIDLPGASHGDDIGYLFYQQVLSWRKPAPGSEDENVVHTMIRLWTNFAKYGNPTPAGDPLTWKPATTDEFTYLNISGRDTQLAENPYKKRADFWTEAYERNAALQHQILDTTANLAV